MKKAALLLFLILWSLLLMAQGGSRHAAHHPPVHILLGGTARAHRSVRKLHIMHLQEAASLSRDGKDREARRPGTSFVPRHALECGGRLKLPATCQWADIDGG